MDTATDYTHNLHDFVDELGPGSTRGVKVVPVGVKKPKVRKFFKLEGMGVRGNEISAHNHSLKNVLRALVERRFLVKSKDGSTLVPPPQPIKGVVRKRLAQVKRDIVAEVPTPTRMTMLEFIGTRPSRLRKRYTDAMTSYIKFGLSEMQAWINHFIKFEKVNLTKKPDPVPRNIQPRSPEYNLRLGMFLSPIEGFNGSHPMYDALASLYGGPTVMKGMNAEQVATNIVEAAQMVSNRWRARPTEVSSRFGWDSTGSTLRVSQETGLVYIGCDASRFDQHVSKDVLKWEHSIYLELYKDHPEISELRWLLKQQLKTKATTYALDDSGVEYKVSYKDEGQRSSGDMNTGLGNCIIMCAMLYVYLVDVLGITNMRVINNGDDAVIIMTKDDYENFCQESFKEWFLEMGFTMTLEDPVYELEKLEFCQSHPIRTPDGWIMVPNIDNLNKFGVALVDKGKIDSWIREVGIAGRLWLAGIPIWYQYFCQYPDSGKEILKPTLNEQNAWSLYWNSLGISERSTEIAEETRLSFWTAFGISPQEQRAAEEQLNTSVPGYKVGSIKKRVSLPLDQLRSAQFLDSGWNPPWGFDA